MSKLRVLVEFWYFMKQTKKFWLLPVALVLLLVGFLLYLATSSVVAPFIYTLF